LDCVTSLAGCPVEIDRWGVDVAYSGAQKCVGALPGLAPITFGPRARAKLGARRVPPRSWYLDLTLIEKYWTGSPRAYHHTSPVNMVYALYEALRLAHEEGLDNRFARHRRNALALRAGARALGLSMYAPDEVMLPPLTPIVIPAGIDDAKLRTMMLEEHAIEIGGGLGDAKGKIWRIGLMGFGAQQRHVALALTALAASLTKLGYRCDAGAALGAAQAAYELGK
jgi:alanine-glyoxylate transaminase/serine-glyoxylate transaminase/serine-pyruvate transaminase